MEGGLMALLVWFTMGIALWHFTVFLPDRFWQGIVGAFVGAVIGSVLFGLIVQQVSGKGLGDTDLGDGADRDPRHRDRPRRRLRDRRPRRGAAPATSCSFCPHFRRALRASFDVRGRCLAWLRAGNPASLRRRALLLRRRAGASPTALGLSEPVAVTLVRRGYRTPEQARAFLAADESHPPAAFDSMDGVVAQVRAAIAAGERITVHGDFDVDGVCATTIMVSTLRELGAECDWLIPDRLADGYGAQRRQRRAARRARDRAADHGRLRHHRGRGGARSPSQLGIEVIVTDHHQAGDELPDCPILHPELERLPLRARSAGPASPGSWPARCGRGPGRRARISTSSPWRRSPTWCRWSARTGRW